MSNDQNSGRGHMSTPTIIIAVIAIIIVGAIALNVFNGKK